MELVRIPKILARGAAGAVAWGRAAKVAWAVLVLALAAVASVPVAESRLRTNDAYRAHRQNALIAALL